MVDRGSTVSACALDLSKAFDRVNFSCLYVKLMDRNVPKTFLTIIICWYSKSYACVKLGSMLSEVFVIKKGVRQGVCYRPSYSLFT